MEKRPPSRSLLAFVVAALGLGPSLAAGSGGPGKPSPLIPQVLQAFTDVSVLIVGERHREGDSHELFYELVATLVSRDERVLVGLEIAADRQGDLDAFLSGQGRPDGLVHPIIDSPSYRELIRRLGDLAVSSGDRLRVMAVDAPQFASLDRDGEMAIRIQEALGSGTYDRAMVLAGNLHALKAIPWSPQVPEPPGRLAQVLERSGIPVASLVQGFRDGCPPRRAVFYPGTHPRAAEAVWRQWGALNTDPSSADALTPHAVDGAILWECLDSPEEAEEGLDQRMSQRSVAPDTTAQDRLSMVPTRTYSATF